MNKSVIALFPLTAIAAAVAVALTACGGGSSSDTTPTTTAKSISFAETAYPTTDAEKREVNASSSVTVDGTAHAIGYNTILRSGDQRGSGIFGLMYDVDGNPLVMTDNSQYISDANDHSTLIDTAGKVFMVSQFESDNAGFYITELSQNSTSGELNAVETKPIDLAGIFGGWTHCAGMRTPWKSHLGSEEYEPDASVAGSANRISAYFGENTGYTNYVAPATSRINAYNYGYAIEVSVTGADMGAGTFASNVNVAKHYSMGRMAHELSYVMPNGKTVYQSDDGTMVGFFRYEADTAEDLSAGTLYAAKLTQTSATNGGSFDLEWINLGHATDGEIRTLIDGGITFSDIFDNNGGDKVNCPADHTVVAANGITECLMLKPGMEKAAAFLESRRYAAMLGATTELNKEEGITYDAEHNRLFVAMSYVEKGMLDANSREDSRAPNYNHVRIDQNSCGIVYGLDVDANMVASNMYAVVSGTPTTYDAASPYYGNTCDVNGIANPDNVSFIPGYNALIIGEDTGSGHQTDLIWSYNMGTAALTRIQTTPYGSETTSPYFYPNVNGFGYLMSVVQHPYGESDTDKVSTGSAERRAYTGYVGPFPAMD